MTIAIPPKINETSHNVMLDFIDHKWAEKVFELRHKIKPLVGSVQKEGTDETDNIVDIRNVEVYPIHEDESWVDKTILQLMINYNQEYNYDLVGMFERPQLLKYSAPSKGYDWHVDLGNGNASTRKLGFSILLNDDFEGGEFLVFNNGIQTVNLEKNQILTFPSFLPHKVNPIKEGIRWSLVCWLHGRCFR